MKEEQQLIYNFVEARPAMRDHDTLPRVAQLMKGEIDEMLAEAGWGDREPSPEEIDKVRLELADVVWYCLSIGNLLGVDVGQALRDKVAINEVRFPAELFTSGDFETIYQNRKKELGEQ